MPHNANIPKPRSSDIYNAFSRKLIEYTRGDEKLLHDMLKLLNESINEVRVDWMNQNFKGMHPDTHFVHADIPGNMMHGLKQAKYAVKAPTRDEMFDHFYKCDATPQNAIADATGLTAGQKLAMQKAEKMAEAEKATFGVARKGGGVDFSKRIRHYQQGNPFEAIKDAAEETEIADAKYCLAVSSVAASKGHWVGGPCDTLEEARKEAGLHERIYRVQPDWPPEYIETRQV